MYRFSSVIFFSALFGTALIILSLGACDRGSEQIKVYRLAKAPLESPGADDQPPATAMGGMGPMQSTNAPVPSGFAQSSSVGAAPPNWEPQTLSQMRQASFLVHGDNGAVADISFVTLGPAAGNVLENVNRWLGQLSQPAVTAEGLTSLTQKLNTPGGTVDIVDLSGKPENGDANKDGRIVAGIAVDQDKTAFYKMRGNAALVGKEKDNFLKWVSSTRAGGGNSAPDTALPPVTGASKPEIKWEVPPGWSPAPASAMRYASFAARDAKAGKVDISVVTFPGDGGDDLQNINRWRQQIGLPGLDEKAAGALTTSIKNATVPFSAVDFAGANSRLVAAWARRDGHVWFIKMTGPATAVEEQKPNFQKFVESVRF
jgi:hypothetical protein